MKQADHLFGSSPASLAFLPSKDVRNAARASSSAPQRNPSSGSLRNTAPEFFAELVCHYGALLDQAVDQRIHENKTFSTALADLSTRLQRLQAGARDIIELHARVLEDKLASLPPLLRSAYVEEGRLVVLELMGRLLSAYRTAFLQTTQAAGSGC